MTRATFVCRSAAKVNLTLDVLGLRADGYHELRSIVHTVGLNDELRFEFGAGNGFSCSEAGLSTADNLCVRAADLFYQAARIDRDRHSVSIALTKTIPAGAGLGGGSGNAAATLAALNRHFGALDAGALAALAARLGADVPLFLQGGCLLIEGIGERITPLPAQRAWLVVVKPRQHGDTKAVFAEWDAVERLSDIDALSKTENLLALLNEATDKTTSNEHIRKIGEAVHNGLRAAAERCGMTGGQIERRLMAAGALGASMSGSGSACYGIYADAESAQEGLAKIRNQPFDHESSWSAPLCTDALRFG